MSIRKNRLTKMAFDFVSLVPAGDDPMARVVISKADPNLPKETRDMSVEINKGDLAPEVVAYIEGLEAEVDDLSKALAEADDNVDGLTEEQLLAKADPAVAKLIKSQKEALAASEAIVKAERDARLTTEFISKAAALPHIGGGTREEFGGLLRRVSESVSKEDAEALNTILAAANEQIEKSDLFKEAGRSGQSTISESAEAAAAAIQKADPTLTKEQAIVKAMEANPALFQEAIEQEEV